MGEEQERKELDGMGVRIMWGPEKRKDEVIERYLTERNAALLAGGEVWDRFVRKYYDGPLPDDLCVEIGLHKTRIHWRDCPPDLLKESVWWLLDNGYHLDIRGRDTRI